MAGYTQTTFAEFSDHIAALVDDPGKIYWTAEDIEDATWEALLVFGAYSNYWRERGVFNVGPANPTPYYDLSAYLPTLRTRTWTLDRMVRDIQRMLQENPGGIAGTGMSGQVDVKSILMSIAVARNRFVLDTHLPLSVHSVISPLAPPDGMVDFDQSSVFVHRASWMDIPSGAWANLWRQDAWSSDKNSILWTQEPGRPQSFSESENAPLRLQLVPPAVNEGRLEVVTVDSLSLDITNPNALFSLPDEWIHAVKYAALSHLLYGEGQIKDVLRAEYAEQRYQQAVAMTKEARSIIRLMVNGVPLPIDSMYAIDSGDPYWRNQTGKPHMAGVMYDMIMVNPGLPDQEYGMTADVVRCAPLPQPNDYIQLGLEDLDNLTDYVTHILVFKCGGQDFKSTFPSYDSFMESISRRKGANAAKIQYLTPLLGQAQKEWAQRPDRLEIRSA